MNANNDGTRLVKTVIVYKKKCIRQTDLETASRTFQIFIKSSCGGDDLIDAQQSVCSV
jgi:hypothetical protein